MTALEAKAHSQEEVGIHVTEEWGYLIIWEFYVRSGMEKRFEAVYGANGDWAQLFKRGEGYVTTDLNRDLKDPRRFLTLDFWTSREAYEKFRERHLAEYEAIDALCESMTKRELEVGRFERVSP